MMTKLLFYIVLTVGLASMVAGMWSLSVAGVTVWSLGLLGLGVALLCLPAISWRFLRTDKVD